jgi:RNA-directed DNA polymerase
MEQLETEVKAEDLFEEVLSYEQLDRAYRKVRANRGAPGIDGVTVEEFGDRLQEELTGLAQEVREWRYKPKAVKRVRIPKPGKKEPRLLGIPCVKDRVLQESIRQTLERIYEPGFSESSYGFRPGRSQKDAIQRARSLVEGGKKWVVDIDLEKFFDQINQDRLMYRLADKVSDKRLLRLIGTTLRSGVLDGHRYEPAESGTPQGSPLSPLLSNITLDELDKELEKRGLSFCRYADDANIFVKSERAGQRVMQSVTRFIEKKLKLKVNKGKSKVAPAKRVRFLGITIVPNGICISKESLKRARAVLCRLIPRRTHRSIERQIAAVNRWYRGWTEYYGITNFPGQLKDIEGHIRRRFRAQMVANQKRRRHLYQALRRRGLSRSGARAAFKPLGIWGMSHQPAVFRAWSNEWFAQLGLYVLSHEHRRYWRPCSDWPRL